MRTIVRDSLIVVVLAAALALAFNGMRPGGIPLVAEEEFEILVPCPDSLGEAIGIGGDADLIRDPTTLLIDARSSEEYEAWHPPHALSQPFDWLASQDEVDRLASDVARSIARSRRHAVVVYGDGGNPDSGEYWAALLSAAGIKNVVFVSGGAGILRGLDGMDGSAK